MRRTVARAVEKIVNAGIPVMGHVGLVPQSVHRMGGFRVQGRMTREAEQLLEDAKSIEEAGAYALVIEGVPSEVGQAITEAVRIPTIGIGAGAATSGQVLVSTDLLGLGRGRAPKFVKRFASLGDEVVRAVSEYVREVRAGEFPDAAHSFRMKEGEKAPGRGAPDSEGSGT
jgi:3-methyl-2-oxobutanoate hydroxymethyltransferase